MATALDRSEGRNVHVYSANDPTTELAGLILNDGITNASFWMMLDVIFFSDNALILRDEHDVVVKRNELPLQPGNYYITGSILIALPGQASC